MKTLKLILTILVPSLLAWSCSHQPNNESKEDHSTHENHTSQPEILTMNHGEKWIVNEEMKPYLQEAENILSTFIETNSTEYKTLANTLRDKNSGLMKSCTMKGESHDELHKWLHPHMALIEALGEEKNEEKAQTIIDNLKKSFETYHHYFQ